MQLLVNFNGAPIYAEGTADGSFNVQFEKGPTIMATANFTDNDAPARHVFAFRDKDSARAIAEGLLAWANS